jgi:hypothetical protein
MRCASLRCSRTAQHSSHRLQSHQVHCQAMQQMRTPMRRCAAPPSAAPGQSCCLCCDELAPRHSKPIAKQHGTRERQHLAVLRNLQPPPDSATVPGRFRIASGHIKFISKQCSTRAPRCVGCAAHPSAASGGRWPASCLSVGRNIGGLGNSVGTTPADAPVASMVSSLRSSWQVVRQRNTFHQSSMSARPSS